MLSEVDHVCTSLKAANPKTSISEVPICTNPSVFDANDVRSRVSNVGFRITFVESVFGVAAKLRRHLDLNWRSHCDVITGVAAGLARAWHIFSLPHLSRPGSTSSPVGTNVNRFDYNVGLQTGSTPKEDGQSRLEMFQLRRPL